jgi:hypothetical protein
VTYDDAIAQALVAASARGCAICRRGDEAGEREVASLSYELVNDPDVRAAIAASWGFCREHAIVLAKQHSAALAIAIIYSDLATRMARLLRRVASGVDDLARRLSGAASCPICLVVARRELDDVAVLRTSHALLATPVHSDHPRPAAPRELPRGAACDGALPIGALAATAREGHALLDAQAQAYERLAARLARVVRQHDYRFASEPFSDWGACWEAMYLFSGTAADRRPG